MGLGDVVEQALSLAGVTQERVEAWLGRPCGCGDRKAKLNMLTSWAFWTRKNPQEAPARIEKMLES